MTMEDQSRQLPEGRDMHPDEGQREDAGAGRAAGENVVEDCYPQ
jgi:hypothetical protein